MAAKNFTTAEMLELALRWLNTGGQRSYFTSVALMAAMLPKLEEVRTMLEDASRRSADEVPAHETLATLQSESFETDREHDNVGGALYGILDACARLGATPEESRGFTTLRDWLFEEGEETFQQSFLSEAGNARRVQNDLKADPKLKKTLASMKLPNGRTVLDAVERYVKAGLKLGELEARKASLADAARASKRDQERKLTPAATRARNAWVKTVNVMLSNATLLDEDEAEKFAPVLREFRTVEARADQRVARRQAAQNDTDHDGADDGDVEATPSPRDAVA